MAASTPEAAPEALVGTDKVSGWKGGGPQVRSTAVPAERDPCLPTTGIPVGVVEVFVDDFIALAQDHKGTRKKGHCRIPNSRRVRRILLHGIDAVFRPVDKTDSPHRREPVSLKKLRKGDCSWSTVKEVLGWVIDTVNMTIHLPERRVKRLADILASLPPTQKRTSVKKWHKVLGELRSMSLAMPGARHLFSHLQNARFRLRWGGVSPSLGTFIGPWTTSDGCLTISPRGPHGWRS